jgi:protoporphyrinogen oxidase
MKKKIVILGAGISGLTTAHWLAKENCDITILEKRSIVGGSMESTLLGNALRPRS